VRSRSGPKAKQFLSDSWRGLADEQQPSLEERVICYLGLGSNIGDEDKKIDYLQRARDLVGDNADTRVVQSSSLYRSPPWGYLMQPDFFNAVISVETRLDPESLLRAVKSVEETLGRRARMRWGPREIDIDILLYGNASLSLPHLTIPHPHLLERAVVLVPLLEIAPDVELPDGRRVRHAVDVSALPSPPVLVSTAW
jgi:2-amino-4-hydroxy-6-hydroxymethyldihydropteridine diphosphokinase